MLGTADRAEVLMRQDAGHLTSTDMTGFVSNYLVTEAGKDTSDIGDARHGRPSGSDHEARHKSSHIDDMTAVVSNYLQ